jgi:CheY-like chemotaxis protein
MPHILVIDDTPNIRTLVRAALESTGYKVTEADNGATGLEAFRQEPADLVLCDLVMPVKDGLEVIGELSQEFPGVPIVAMSGGSLDGRFHLLPVAESLGAIALLPKPFRAATVLAMVEMVLGEQHATGT